MKTGMFWGVALSFLLLTACNDKEIETEKAKLELARTKQDLDQMFLSSRKLTELGDKEAKTELPRITDAIRTREAMLTAIADHDHEAVLVAADKLLALSPQNKDATRALRESGQIFWLLSRAQSELAAVSEQYAVPPEVNRESLTGSGPDAERLRINALKRALRDLGQKTAPNDDVMAAQDLAAMRELEPSYQGDQITDDVVATFWKKVRRQEIQDARIAWDERRFVAIRNAREMVSKARSLDPQFKGSLQLEELLEKAQAEMIVDAAVEIYLAGSYAFLAAAQANETILNGLNQAARMRSGSIQEMWNLMSPLASAMKRTLKYDYLKRLEATSKNLASYKGGPALALAEEAQKFAVMSARNAERLLEPTGSLVDFRKASLDSMDEFKLFDVRFKAALPRKTDADEFTAAAKAVVNYGLYSRGETPAIIRKNEKVISL